MTEATRTDDTADPGVTRPDGGESLGTVLIAGAVNLAIAVAKAIAGVLGGSAAMLAEAAHSVADTTTEALLLVAIRRGARPADETHPFGHGKSSYVWAMLAAFATLLVGAGFAITQGVHAIVVREKPGSYLISYIVLVVSFALESVSLARAISQLRGGARRWRVPLLRYLRRTPDTTVKAVTFEDSAALVGLTIALLGLGLSEITGSPIWDGAASIAIGVLLALAALVLVRANVSLIVGEAPPAGLRDQIVAELESVPEVVQVIELLTMYLGPSSLLIAARVTFSGNPEAAADEAERRLRARFPLTTYVFLDPTPGPSEPPPIRTRPPGGPTSTV